jgi:hypothetical protein
VTDARLHALLDGFRTETAHRSRDARILRARVLEKLETRRRRRRPILWLIPLFAVFIGAGALAAKGRGTETFAELLSRLRARDPAPTESRPRPPAAAKSRATPRVSEPTTSTKTESAFVTLDELPVAASRITATDRPVAAPGVAATDRVLARRPRPAPADLPVREQGTAEQLALYRVAHDLYFRHGSFARAVEAFQAYLDAYPGGVLSLEARFNEGACLARLGRKHEAVRFLQPFADGTHGEYLRNAAKDLLSSTPSRTRTAGDL